MADKLEDRDKATFKPTPVGKTGTLISSGIVLEEYLNELIGQEGHERYDKMRRSDSQIRKILAAINGPIKAATWMVSPASEDTIDIEAAALMEQILFKDINWNAKLSEMLTFIPHGHSIFEVSHRNVVNSELGPYTGLLELGFRKQATIRYWHYDRSTSSLESLEQYQSGDLEVDTKIPAENLAIFFNEQEGSDSGFPILRPLYGPYKRKLLTETLKMIGIERFAIQTPTLQFPSNISPNDREYKEALNVVENFTSGENAFIMYPEGWTLDLSANGQFDPMKLEDSIKREDEKMASAIVATFLELGTGGNGGAFALSENLERFFSVVIEGFAKVIKDTINCDIIPNLVRLNFADRVKTMPELTFSGITDRAGKNIMEIITGYVSGGVIEKDEQLEDYVRRIHKLPKKAEGEALDNEESEENTEDVDNNEDDKDDVEDVAEADDGPDDGPAKDDDSKQFAERKLSPKSLIVNQGKVISSVIRDKMTFSSEKLINDIMNRYKKESKATKLNALAGVKIGGQAQYKRVLRGTLSTTAGDALDMVALEVPVEGKVKLKNNDSLEAFLLADDAALIKGTKSIFNNLPKHVKLLVEKQSAKIVDSSLKNLEDRVAFQFMSDAQSIQDENRIRQNLEDVAKEEIEAAKYDTAGINAASQTVNQSRNAYLFSPDVVENVYAFRFTNSSPKSAICSTLAGRVFSTNDAEFAAFSPPLHHNCKSYLSAILVSGKSRPAIEPLPPISEQARKSITLSSKAEYEFFIDKYLDVYNEG